MYKNESGRFASLSLLANSMAAAAVIWPAVPPNQCAQLKSQRFGVPGCGRNRAPIGCNMANVNAIEPRI